MKQKLHGGKKRLIWIMICGVLFISIPIQASAKQKEEQKTFAQRECEREIGDMKIAYQAAREEGKISRKLYDEVNSFLDETQARFMEESDIEVYENFPSQYQEVLYRYLKENNRKFLEAEKDSITYVFCKADKSYIQKELAIYGATINEEELKAQTDCQWEIGEIESAYQRALEKSKVSEDLYNAAMKFLQQKEEELIEENAIMIYNTFSEDYIAILKRYAKEEMNDLGDSLVNATGEEIEKYKKQYNLDMLYIEEEIEIQCGKRIILQLSEKEFQQEFDVLTAVG